MSNVFRIKRFNTSPGIRYDVTPKTMNLSGATVRFKLMDSRGKTVLDSPGTVIEATGNPSVGYAWENGDTDIAGDYKAEFDVVFFDGSLVTFPNDQFLVVSIGPNIPNKDEA